MPLIRRPHEHGEPPEVDPAELQALAAQAQRAAAEPAARPTLRAFYRAAPWLYPLVAETKVAASGEVDRGLESFDRSRHTLEQALALGFADEAGALAVSAARLAWRMFSAQTVLRSSTQAPLRWRTALLEAYEGLGQIDTLPADDAAWWADRYAETAAALFPMVAAYDWPPALAGRARMPHLHVAMRTAAWARADAGEALVPLRVADFHPGGVARLQASLAHLEAWNGRLSSAGPRLEQLLAAPIAEPSDHAYAWTTALATARRGGQATQHAEWRAGLLRWIDAARRPWASFEGRLFAQQAMATHFEYALRVWADANLHHADDIWTIAEALKARLLLDDLAGCTTPPDPAAPATHDPPSTAPDTAPRFRAAVLGASGLDSDVLTELAQSSHWALGALGGIESGAPGEQSALAAMQAEATRERQAQDAPRAARDGGYAGSAPPADPEALRAALLEDELLIEVLMPRDPFAPNREGWIVVAQRSGNSLHGFRVVAEPAPQWSQGEGRLIERGPLSDRVAQARAAILAGDEAGAEDALRFLFDLLIGPVLDAGHLPERATRWIVVPHGPLHNLPWGALIDPQGRHLIERVALVIAPSASVWLHQVQAVRRPVARWLGLGNPGPLVALDDLPHARDEVLEAQRRWQAAGLETTCLTDAAATEAALVAALPAAELVHIAAHGRLDLRHPRDGHAIVLAPAAEGDPVADDGALEARDLRRLDLRGVQLAVLNLCHGVFCRHGPGDEPLGLLSACLAAGVGSVVGPLWALPDEPARRFMGRVVDALCGGAARGDPAAALREAARRALAEGWPTAHWAGMVAVGSGRPFALVTADAPGRPAPRAGSA